MEDLQNKEEGKMPGISWETPWFTQDCISQSVVSEPLRSLRYFVHYMDICFEVKTAITEITAASFTSNYFHYNLLAGKKGKFALKYPG